jgi:hypothetical protein
LEQTKVGSSLFVAEQGADANDADDAARMWPELGGAVSGGFGDMPANDFSLGSQDFKSGGAPCLD